MRLREKGGGLGFAGVGGVEAISSAASCNCMTRELFFLKVATLEVASLNSVKR